MSHPEFLIYQGFGISFEEKRKKKEPLINLGIQPHQKNKRFHV